MLPDVGRDWRLARVGRWLSARLGLARGAILLKVSPEILKTVALAVTQLTGHAEWSEKESEEQLWVVRYIQEILEDYQVSAVDLTARRRIVNGPLEHLYT